LFFWGYTHFFVSASLSVNASWVREVAMKKDFAQNDGLKNLIMSFRKAFNVPENINHYTERDLKNAERSFVRCMLNGNHLSDASPQRPPPP
jgi:hypothetical protein